MKGSCRPLSTLMNCLEFRVQYSFLFSRMVKPFGRFNTGLPKQAPPLVSLYPITSKLTSCMVFVLLSPGCGKVWTLGNCVTP